MRIFATAVAASHVFLTSCETGPERPSRPVSHGQVRGIHYVRSGVESRERIEPGLLCHAKRRVVGEEQPSKADAQRAAENAWMGSIRYDHGERYQDLNHAKDVRLNCDPSSVSAILKTPHFRCVVEATPCRATVSATAERVGRRHEEEANDDSSAPK